MLVNCYHTLQRVHGKVLYTTEQTAEAILLLLDSWACSTDEDRVEVLSIVKDRLCIHCGRLTTEVCHCENDE